MESKRTQRKLNSYFWYILYTLPLLTLLVLFVGYLTFYKSTGSELKSQEKVVTYEYNGTDYVTTELVEKLYLNINLSVEEVDNYLSTLEYYELTYYIFCNDNYVLGIMDASIFDTGYIIMFSDVVNNSQEIIYVSSPLYSAQLGSTYLGWNPDFNGILEFNSLSNEIGMDEVASVNPSNISSYLVSTTPIEVIETIEIKDFFFTIPFEENIHYEEVPPVLLSSTSKKFYFNTNIGLSDFYDLCSSIVGDLDNYFFTTDKSKSLWIARANDGYNNNFYYLMYNDEIAFSGAIIGDSDIDFIGWNPILNNSIAFDIPANLDFDKIALFGDLFVEELSVPSYEEKISYQLSLFDYSLVQSINTFDGFVVPVLSDGLNTIFGYLKLDTTTFIARFVILLFTWMIQLKFIHIVIDMLSLVPDLYHEFANGRKC